jgi:hypothetical protein
MAKISEDGSVADLGQGRSRLSSRISFSRRLEEAPGLVSRRLGLRLFFYIEMKFRVFETAKTLVPGIGKSKYFEVLGLRRFVLN